MSWTARTQLICVDADVEMPKSPQGIVQCSLRRNALEPLDLCCKRNEDRADFQSRQVHSDARMLAITKRDVPCDTFAANVECLRIPPMAFVPIC